MKKIFFLTSTLSFLLFSCKKHEDIDVADELKYSIDFSQDDHSWLTDGNHQVISGTTGFYRMTQNQQNYQSWGFAPFGTINYDYSISADVKLYVNNPYFGGVGIIFNYIDNSHYYAFYIRNDGSVYVFKKVASIFTTLVNPTLSTAIKKTSGETNRVEVRQVGSTATLIVNSVTVGSCNATRSPGLVAAGVALSTSSSPYFMPLTGEFDNVAIYKIN